MFTWMLFGRGRRLTPNQWIAGAIVSWLETMAEIIILGRLLGG